MQIGVITGSKETELAFAFGLPHQGTIQYLSNKMSSFQDSLLNLPTTVKGMFGDIQRTFNNYFSDEAIEKARKALHVQGADINLFSISTILTIEAAQQANLINQRWIMAEPTLRALHNKQLVDGFSGSYFDTDPGTIRDTHYDYRRAIDGYLVEEADGEFCCNVYLEDELREGDSHLCIQEQAKIELTWNFLKQHLSQKRVSLEDPTNPNGGFL